MCKGVVTCRRIDSHSGLRRTVMRNLLGERHTANLHPQMASFYRKQIDELYASLSDKTEATRIMMQIAMLFGFITSYPANLYLLKAGVKRRCSSRDAAMAPLPAGVAGSCIN